MTYFSTPSAAWRVQSAGPSRREPLSVPRLHARINPVEYEAVPAQGGQGRRLQRSRSLSNHLFNCL